MTEVIERFEIEKQWQTNKNIFITRQLSLSFLLYSFFSYYSFQLFITCIHSFFVCSMFKYDERRETRVSSGWYYLIIPSFRKIGTTNILLRTYFTSITKRMSVFSVYFTIYISFILQHFSVANESKTQNQSQNYIVQRCQLDFHSM